MTVKRDIDALHHRVWEVLADGWTYSQWVVGNSRITLRLTDVGDGCRVEMSEAPDQGPMNFIPDRIAAIAVDVRNRECLWRLENLAWQRDSSELEDEWCGLHSEVGRPQQN
jgi:hypothetical protein